MTSCLLLCEDGNGSLNCEDGSDGSEPGATKGEYCNYIDDDCNIASSVQFPGRVLTCFDPYVSSVWDDTIQATPSKQ